MDIQILLALQTLRSPSAAVCIGIVHFFLQASGPALFMTVYPLLFQRLEKRTTQGDVVC